MCSSRQCILQVEDDENDAFLVERAFARAGVNRPLRVARDGQQAVDYLSLAESSVDPEQYPLPCLVLLDLNLPGMSGLDLLAWIRKQPRIKRLVVILFSSSVAPADVERAYELGANSVVQKPNDLSQAAEFAQLLNGWWLGFNRFAAFEETQPPVYARACTAVDNAPCTVHNTTEATPSFP